MSGTEVSAKSSAEWWAERRAKQLAAAKALRDEHFADPAATIPDLDFAPPDCPICLEETTYEDGAFICEVCRIQWPSNGYGHKAERWKDGP